MANYKDIVGTAVRNNAGNIPTAETGQVWFDSTNIDFKYQFPTTATAWRTANNMNTGRRLYEGGAGTQTAAIVFSGFYSPGSNYEDKTESFDGV